MKFESIDEIYEVNASVREQLLGVIGGIREEDEALPTENGKWTVAKVVEHLAKVDNSMMRICAKLLSKARDQGLEADPVVKISPHFIEAFEKLNDEETKLTAPEIVQPEGGNSVRESIEILNYNREKLTAMRGIFDECDGTAFTFPHPAFGNLTALDWLALIGGHESRHLVQIEKILARKDAAKA